MVTAARGVSYETMRESVPGWSIKLESGEFVFLRKLGFSGLLICDGVVRLYGATNACEGRGGAVCVCYEAGSWYRF